MALDPVGNTAVSQPQTGSANPEPTASPTPSGATSTPTPSTTQTADPPTMGGATDGPRLTEFLNYLKQHKDEADLNQDGKLSFDEVSALTQKENAPQIDSASFDALAALDSNPADLLFDPTTANTASIKANDFLTSQITKFGSPLPSDYLVAALVLTGKIADPTQLTEADQTLIENLEINLASKGADSLSAEERDCLASAANIMLTVEQSYATKAFAAAPELDQADAINTLRTRLSYEAGLAPLPPIDPSTFDYQSLLSGNGGNETFNMFILNSTANQLKKMQQGNLGQTDTAPRVLDGVRLHKKEGFVTYGESDRLQKEEWKELSESQQAFVDTWIEDNGEITAENVGALCDALNTQFHDDTVVSDEYTDGSDNDYRFEAYWPGKNPWAGQQENLPELERAEVLAYREWNSDGTPKIYAPSHLANNLAKEIHEGFEPFKNAVKTLVDTGAFAVMDQLEDATSDQSNNYVSWNGLNRLAGELEVFDPRWASWNVPPEKRQAMIDAARELLKPEQRANLGSLMNDEQCLGLGECTEWLNKPPLQDVGKGPGSDYQRTASANIGTLSDGGLAIMAVMDYLEGMDGSAYSMDNYYIGMKGLTMLSQLTPDSPEWDACAKWNDDNGRPDEGVVPVEQRQAMIDAAKWLLDPANAEILTQLKDTDGCFNADTWKNWRDANPTLANVNAWLDHVEKYADDIYQPIIVKRDRMNTVAGIFADFFSAGLATAGYTATHRPHLDATQALVRKELVMFDRNTEVIDQAMSTANEEWAHAVDVGFRFAIGFLPLSFVPATGVAANAIGRAGASIGRALGTDFAKTAATALSHAAPFLQNIIDPLSLLDIARVVGGASKELAGLVTKVAAKVFGEASKVPSMLTDLIATASRTSDPAASLEQLKVIEAELKNIPADTLTADQKAVLDSVTKTKEHFQRAIDVQAALSNQPMFQKTSAKPDAPKAATQSKAGTDDGATLSLGQPPVRLYPDQISSLKKSTDPFSPGWTVQMEIGEETKTFSVVKTTDGEYIIGRHKAMGKTFEATDTNGNLIGTYFPAENNRGYYRGGLQGGGNSGSVPRISDEASGSGSSAGSEAEASGSGSARAGAGAVEPNPASTPEVGGASPPPAALATPGPEGVAPSTATGKTPKPAVAQAAPVTVNTNPATGAATQQAHFADAADQLSTSPSGAADAATTNKRIGYFIKQDSLPVDSPLLSVTPDENGTTINAGIQDERWVRNAGDHLHAVAGDDPWGSAGTAEQNEVTKAIAYYAEGYGAEATNDLLRNGMGAEKLPEIWEELIRQGRAMPIDSTAEELVTALKRCLVDIPPGTQFTRGFGLDGDGSQVSASMFNETKNFLANSPIGTVLEEPGFTSTAPKHIQNAYTSNGNSVRFEFTAAEDVQVIPLWVDRRVEGYEALFPPGQRFVITGREWDHGILVVKATLLANKGV